MLRLIEVIVVKPVRHREVVIFPGQILDEIDLHGLRGSPAGEAESEEGGEQEGGENSHGEWDWS